MQIVSLHQNLANEIYLNGLENINLEKYLIYNIFQYSKFINYFTNFKI